jgi:hypothetical protein
VCVGETLDFRSETCRKGPIFRDCLAAQGSDGTFPSLWALKSSGAGSSAVALSVILTRRESN